MTGGPSRAKGVVSASGAGSAKRPGSQLRVMIVDDHPVVRAGLSRVIEDELDMTVCCDVDSAADALAHVHANAPDLAIVDLALAAGSGLELISTLSTSHPTLPILVLSMHDERLYAERALQAGASGYIMKHRAPHDLVDAVRRVWSGKTYLSTEMSERVLAAATGRRSTAAAASLFDSLTNREREVYALIGRGLGTGDIAAQLHLSVKTIESHRARIKEKLGLRTSTELVRSATLWTAP